MGAFFTNCNVRTKDKAKCAQLLASSINSRALMTDPKNGWITVYDEGCESRTSTFFVTLPKDFQQN
ncbi:MAG: hypothetical protein DMG37_07200 [Acidobacteria bacterium]|nr:MAG: hypothetical protein DMG37_07200 [Acidobacteriota bacterium]